MNIRSNSIVNKTDTDAVNLPNKATLPSGSVFNVQGNINISGIATVGFLTAQNANVSGVVTATTFVGDGSGLQGVPTLSSAKSVALRYIIADHPHRS